MTEQSRARQYRKKPIFIEAVQWFKFGDHPAVVPYTPAYESVSTNRGKPSIKTLEGDIHFVSEGDWIIQGVKGEFYACKPDIFAMTYELASLSERGTPVGWIQELADGRKVFYKGDLDPREVHDNGKPCYRVFK